MHRIRRSGPTLSRHCPFLRSILMRRKPWRNPKRRPRACRELTEPVGAVRLGALGAWGEHANRCGPRMGFYLGAISGEGIAKLWMVRALGLEPRTNALKRYFLRFCNGSQ